MFKLEFKTDNAAFGESKVDLYHEIEHILQNVGRNVRSYGHDCGLIFDSNGNVIGSFELTED